MINGIEILTMALVDFGCDSEVNGEILRVIPSLKGETILSGDNMIDHTGPSCQTLQSSVEGLATPLTAGNNGDIITILGRTFRILVLDPDEDGGIIMFLEET